MTLVVKATRLCNLRCSYCHDWRVGKNQKMAFPVMAHVMAAALGDSTHAHINVIWHGGEPTILGIPFFKRALIVQSRLRREGQEIENSIQTNGTRITAEWAQFFLRHNIGVGVSIDGPPAIHNKTRAYANGRPSWADVRAGLRILHDHDVKSSVLMVVDREALRMGAQRLFDFFLDEGIKKFGFLAAKPGNNPKINSYVQNDDYVTPPEMMQFLVEMQGCVEREGDPEVEVRELEILKKRLLGSNERPCTLVGGCIGNFFVVEPDGNIAHCDLFLGDATYEFGNIIETSFADIRESKALKATEAKNNAELSAMAECPEFGVCSGWCPHERYVSVRHNTEHNSACCGLRPLIRRIRSWVESMEAPSLDARQH